MPEDKNLRFRIKVIDSLLSNPNHYNDVHTISDVCNEELGIAGLPTVSERTIQKDILRLQEAPYNAKIEQLRRGRNIYYTYTIPGFSIYKKEVKGMSNEERALLTEVLKTIGQFDGLPNFEWMENMRTNFELDDSRKIISFSVNRESKNSNMLAGLYSAISNRQVIELNYHPQYKEKVHTVLMHPYLLKQYNDSWFLFGAVDSDDFIMNQPLDRIESFKLVPEMKYRECSEDLEERFEDIVGVTLPVDAEPQDILVWADDMTYKRIDAKPIHYTHTVQKRKDHELRELYPQFGDKGKFIKYKCIINRELKRDFISYQEGLVVLEPKKLREDIKKTLVSMSINYKD